ncbi:MAG: hypothetical protein V8T87_08875 [Victivallales bacterium]
MIAFIRSRPYYHQIAGFGLDGGEDGQFMQWTGRNLNYLGDYSPAMKRYFRATLLKKSYNHSVESKLETELRFF